MTQTYLQNRNSLTDTENRLVGAKRERERDWRRGGLGIWD